MLCNILLPQLFRIVHSAGMIICTIFHPIGSHFNFNYRLELNVALQAARKLPCVRYVNKVVHPSILHVYRLNSAHTNERHRQSNVSVLLLSAETGRATWLTYGRREYITFAIFVYISCLPNYSISELVVINLLKLSIHIGLQCQLLLTSYNSIHV